MSRKRASSNNKRVDFSGIRLLICDFDGVMTDNTVRIGHDGKESIVCHRGDGMGIELLRAAGVEAIVITKEKGALASQRCKKLGIACASGIHRKLDVLHHELKKRNFTVQQACYIGNDVNDIECIEACRIGVAVADAHPDVLTCADLVTEYGGGKGAVREVCDIIIEHTSRV